MQGLGGGVRRRDGLALRQIPILPDDIDAAFFGWRGTLVEDERRADERAGDVSEEESVGARDFFGGEEPVEIGEGVVNALHGLEVVAVIEEFGGEFGGFGLSVFLSEALVCQAVAGGRAVVWIGAAPSVDCGEAALMSVLDDRAGSAGLDIRCCC